MAPAWIRREQFTSDQQKRRHTVTELLAQLGLVAAAGFLAGGVNTLAGGGTLLAYPALFAWMVLVNRPGRFFQAVIPYLVPSEGAHERGRNASGALITSVFVASIYGSYFSAGVGVLLLTRLGATIRADFHKINGLKNALSLLIITAASRSMRFQTESTGSSFSYSCRALASAESLTGTGFLTCHIRGYPCTDGCLRYIRVASSANQDEPTVLRLLVSAHAAVVTSGDAIDPQECSHQLDLIGSKSNH